MKTEQKFIFACGGTGGHIFPGIAVAQQLRSAGCDVMFIGNRNSMESVLVPAEGFAFREIHAQKIYRKLTPKNILVPFLLAASFIKAMRIIRRYHPLGVFCTGSYVSGPVASAAILMRVPLYLHESNSYPGLTIRLLARFARITFTSFSATSSFLSKANIRQLGIPLPEVKAAWGSDGIAETGLESTKPIILVTGGSQGSQAINSAIDMALDSILDKGYQVIWQTGRTGFAQYSSKYSTKKGLFIFDFSPRLRAYYQHAQIAITRAGAMTIAELEEFHLPAILIPLPTAAENHQFYNAQEQQQKGRALLLNQADLTSDSLLDKIEQIQRDYTPIKSSFDNEPNTSAIKIAECMLNDLNREDDHAGKN